MKLNAQQNPFSEIYFSLKYLENMDIKDLHEYWEANHGAYLSTETNFYTGFIGIGVETQYFESRNLQQPDYRTLFINISWRYKLEISGKAGISAGVRSGSYLMLFDDSEQSEFENTESELAVSSFVNIDIPVASCLMVNFNSDFITVFTKKRVKLFNASAGLTYIIETPKWIKNVLE
ncbi:MAG: hypothetical protein JW995_05355 [Melioribacteraceae bacterium]|nr:hypothetical protein [Melioribacteraceae bacterium]